MTRGAGAIVDYSVLYDNVLRTTLWEEVRIFYSFVINLIPTMISLSLCLSSLSLSRITLGSTGLLVPPTGSLLMIKREEFSFSDGEQLGILTSEICTGR